MEEKDKMETDSNNSSDNEDTDAKTSKEEESKLEDSSGDEEESALEQRAQELEKEVLDNKFLYESHAELVGIYKKQADLNSMRLAYERFHETFPLTSTLWLDWIQIEIQLASTQAEKKNIVTLFRKAVIDYLSVKLWMEFAQYAVGSCEINETRSILNEALTAAGLHVTEGSLIWDTLREFELAHLSAVEPNSKDFNEQLQKVVDVFKRQLSVPLLNMKDTYLEWTEFVNLYPDNKIDTKAVEWGYKKALKLLETYKPFEDKLLMARADEEIFDAYKEYIKFVKDPIITTCLYERAIEKLCLNPSIWIDYCNFVIKLGNIDLQINLSKRAIRNVTWNEELWVLGLRILEFAKKDAAEVLKFFEEGLLLVSSNLNLWVAYLEYANRNFEDKEKLFKLFCQAEDALGETDAMCLIPRWHARLLAKHKDMEGSRKLWSKILHNPKIKSSAHFLIEYSNLERHYGTPQQLRALFLKALSSCKDWPQSIAEEWLMFEREEGTIEDVIKCSEKVKDYLAPKAVAREYAPVAEKRERKGYQKSKPLEFDSRGHKVQNRKRGHEDDELENTLAKKTKLFKPKDHSKGIPDDLDPLKSIFLSNITPVITEQRIKELFPNGKVTLASDSRGESRCFAYIQYQTEDEATEALKRDRELVDERPMFISKCKTDPKERRKIFKYPTTPEETKLFVRGLPIRQSQADIENLFKPYNCNNVRIVTHRNGQSKGLAYIEFDNEKDTLNAMKATDQMNINGFVISVAISAPPTKERIREPGARDRHHEGGSRDRNRRFGHDAPIVHPYTEVKEKPSRKLSVPLIPRSVQTKQQKEGDPTPPTVAKTNADFRKMLLEK